MLKRIISLTADESKIYASALILTLLIAFWLKQDFIGTSIHVFLRVIFLKIPTHNDYSRTETIIIAVSLTLCVKDEMEKKKKYSRWS